MILDGKLELASSFPLPLLAAALITASENIIDLGVARDIGGGETLYTHINIETAPAGGGGDLAFVWYLAAITNDADPVNTGTILLQSRLYGTGGEALTAKLRIVLPIPVLRIRSTGARYFGLLVQKTGTTNFATNGVYSAHVVHGVEDQRHYPSALSF